MNSVLEKNIAKMTGDLKGDMLPLLDNESIGGNAGVWQGYPCVAANFSFDSKTGEIKYFENIQHVPKEILSLYERGTLRLAFDSGKSRKFYIINCYIKKYTALAKSNLENTTRFYNNKYGFEPNLSKESTVKIY